MQLGDGSRKAIATLALSAAGLVAIVSHEAYVPVAKPPVAGDVCTNGFGATEGVKCGDVTTPEKALARALRDVEKRDIGRCVTVPLHQYEYDAYSSLAFNIGIEAFCRSTLVRKLNAGDYAGACAAISDWDKFKGKPLPGLTRRRADERAMCEGRP